MTILNTYVVETPTFLGPVMWVPIIVGFGIGFYLIYSDFKDIAGSILIGVIFASIGALLGCLLSMGFGPFTEARYYEVTFDEETSIVEVMKDYDIVEQRGDIFVLEDKEASE